MTEPSNPSSQPTLKTRFMAALHGEVSAKDLEAYRTAGASAFAILDSVADGFSPWIATEQKRIEVLCGWVAFALQTAGDALLEADYATDPNTVGFIPAVTQRQALSFYEEVDDWACRAKEAEVNPTYRLDARLPTPWPAWFEVQPCPRPHLAAMIGMAEKFGQRVLLLLEVGDVQAGSEQEAARNHIRQLLARGDQRRDRATALWHHQDASQQRHENIEDEVQAAIAAYFLAGQLMAMPDLANQSGIDSLNAGLAPRALPGPGEAAFDVWCLTDPSTRAAWKGDRAALRAVDALWQYDPDPRATLTIQAQIDAALAAGDIADRKIHYFCCPWASIYQVVNPVTLGGKRLRRGKSFTYDVSAEEMAEGGVFKREILVADFSPTSEVDYCNPEAGETH